MKKIDWLVVLFLVFSSIYALKDLFKAGFYTSHDGIHQVVRLYYFDQAIKDGHFPPRWVGGLLNGFGYPLFIFSYHFPWFMAEPLYLLGLSIFASIKMTFLLGFIFSGITMYFFQKALFGRLGAFVGTIVYLYAPYRFSNIFVRAAIGDATSFIFPPLLFLSFYKLKREKKMNCFWLAVGALGFAGLFLSHAMVFLFFFLALIFYIGYFVLFCSKKLKFLIASLSIIILGFGISAYYFLPSLIERHYTKFSEIMTDAFFGKTFLSFKELLYSPWGYGMMRAKEGGMSLQLGVVQWGVIGLAGLVILQDIMRKKVNKEVLFYFFLFCLTIFLMLPFSLPLWKIITKFAFIDFTWRVLPVPIFAVSVLAGFLVSSIKFKYFLAFLVIFLSFYANRNHLRVNQILDWPLSFYLELEKTTNSFDEYTPYWVRGNLKERPKEKVEFLEGSAKVAIIENKSHRLTFEIETEKEGRVRINTIYYPGWKIWVNGELTEIDYQGNGLMEFPVRKGKGKVVAKFTETPLRLFSDFLTFISLVFLGAFFLKTKFLCRKYQLP